MSSRDTDHRSALVALATASALFGLTVPLTKLALGWLDPAWLASARFMLAAPALALLGRHALRRAATPAIAAYGAVGYGAVILLQNSGVAQTSVLHATVILGAVPAFVALTALVTGRGNAGPRTWGGLGVALLGMSLVAGSGGNASLAGDGLVLASAVLMAVFTVAQAQLLRGQDTVAVTAIQTSAAGVVATLVALTGDAPATSATPGQLAAVLTLVLAGTLIPFALFARGQARTSAETAGVFLNVEPLVGALIGVLAFHDPFGGPQALGATAVMVGILFSIERSPTPQPAS